MASPGRSARRRRLALLALFALLFQQAAMVAYACALVQMPATPVAMMADCEGMAAPAPELPGLCDRHCNPDTPTSPDLRAGHVPPLALPPLVFQFDDVLALPVIGDGGLEVPVCRSDPPPTLRFCSLLI